MDNQAVTRQEVLDAIYDLTDSCDRVVEVLALDLDRIVTGLERVRTMMDEHAPRSN